MIADGEEEDLEAQIMGEFYADTKHGYGSHPDLATNAAAQAHEAAADAWYADWRARRGAVPTTSPREEFLVSLPPLNSRRNARRYITRVAIGFSQKLITSQEMKTMLYAAQVALSAAPPPTPRSVPPAKRRTKGFAS